MELASTLWQYEPERLERAPIALAISQLRFPTILSIPTNDNLLASFQDAVRELYPLLFIGHQFGLNVGPQGVEQQLSTRVFQFMDTDQQWTVSLSSDALSLETRHYASFKEFSDRVLRIIEAAKDIYRISTRQRVGLRYVNEIRYQGANVASDWGSLIKPEVLGPLSVGDLSPSITSSSQELSLRIPDGALTMRHGFFPQGTTVVPSQPDIAPPEGAFYLLDFDAFDDQTQVLDVGALNELLRSFNKTVFGLFRWGLQDRLFEHLKGSA